MVKVFTKQIIRKKMMNKIFLIGPMGVGKTAVGKVLAKNLNYHFFDIDNENQWKNRHIMSRNKLYWNYRDEYHDIESDILKDYTINNNKNSIISTGGATVLRLENKNLMESNGIVVYLKADGKTLDNRMKNHSNKSMRNWYMSQTITIKSTERYLNERKSHYKFADLEINTNDKSIEEVCLMIESWIY